MHARFQPVPRFRHASPAALALALMLFPFRAAALPAWAPQPTGELSFMISPKLAALSPNLPYTFWPAPAQVVERQSTDWRTAPWCSSGWVGG